MYLLQFQISTSVSFHRVLMVVFVSTVLVLSHVTAQWAGKETPVLMVRLLMQQNVICVFKVK